MPAPTDVIGRALAQIHNLAAARRYLATAPQSALRGARGDESREVVLEFATADEAMDLLATGETALEKLQKDGTSARLSDREAMALEAVILTVGRPALLIQQGSFPPAPVGWESLEDHRPAIENTIPSVGRIDIVAEKKRYHLGTGFVVAPNLVMTNAHIVQKLARRDDDGTWMFYQGREHSMEMIGEKGSADSWQFRISNVNSVHPTFDLALIDIEPVSTDESRPAPAPLRFARIDPSPQVDVYLLGYPEADKTGETPKEVIEEIFGKDYGVKRLQPGRYAKNLDDGPTFAHDCSTLGGNSGSCVVDLQTNEVIGLHFRGYYGVQNDAIALWKLRDDPLLKSRVEFD